MSEDAGQDSLDEVVGDEENEHGERDDSWQRYTMEEFSEWIEAGGTPKTSNDDYWNGEIPWVQTGELTKGRISSTEKYITEEGLENSTAKRFPKETLLIGMYGETVGESALLEIEATTNQACCGIFADYDKVNSAFLHQMMQYEKPRLYSLRAGSGQQNIRQGIIRKFEVEIPPLSEQRKIASVLYNVDEAIRKTEEIIEQTKRVKKGVASELLSRGVTEDGNLRPAPDQTPEIYEEYQTGTIPERWDIKPVSEIVPDDRPVTYGIVQPGSYTEGGVPMIRGQNYIGGWEPLSEFFRVDPELHEEYIRCTTRPGDVLLSIAGDTGATNIVPDWIEEANLTQTTARIAVDDSVAIPEYILHALDSRFVQTQIEGWTKGSVQSGLNLGRVEKFQIPIPPMAEQEEIVAKISSVEERISNESDAKENLSRLKQGLMQELLTGEVRTRDRDIEVLPEVEAHG